MMIEEYECPMLKKTIDMSECYDIQMVRSHCIIESFLDFKLDREKADKLCTDCSFNQFKQSKEVK